MEMNYIIFLKGMFINKYSLHSLLEQRKGLHYRLLVPTNVHVLLLSKVIRVIIIDVKRTIIAVITRPAVFVDVICRIDGKQYN